MQCVILPSVAHRIYVCEFKCILYVIYKLAYTLIGIYSYYLGLRVSVSCGN